jgi:hypothetical protein
MAVLASAETGGPRSSRRNKPKKRHGLLPRLSYLIILSLEEKTFPPADKRNLKLIFSSLIDTMRDAQRMQESERKVREIEEESKRQNASLDKMKREFTEVVLSHKDTLGNELAGDLEKQVSSLTLVALDITRKKIDRKNSTELKDSQTALESDRTKTFKSLEAFLATLPFSVLDKSMGLKLLGVVYSADVRYNCAGNIQFEFSLDCNKSTVLNKEFKLTSPEGQVKVPLSLGKSWRKKEPSPDYEELDHYVLSTAEVTEAHLDSTYKYPEKSSTIRIISSKRDSHASLTVEYESPEAKLNITSEPTLNKFLDSEQIDKSSDALRQSILELESYKTDLVKLVSDGNVVFGAARFDVQLFLAKAWKIIEPEVRAALSKGDSVAEGNWASDREVVFDQTFVRQKIVTLGESGNALLASLNLN